MHRRNYLSAAYSLDSDWAARRSADPLLQDIDAEQLFVDISKKLSLKTRESIAVDVDIFVNCLENETTLQELENAVHRLRRSRHTAGTLPSTACAVVRYMLHNGFDKRLVQMLEDRYGFGIFPDRHTNNLLLNHFLTKPNMEREAVKVAAEIMLQEDHGNQITRILSLIACAKYLTAAPQVSAWVEQSTSAQDQEEDEEDDEEVYVRVPNLTNPWFDDHFDLQNDASQLVGKTLLHFASAAAAADPGGCLLPRPVVDSARLVGLARRRRWDELRKQLALATVNGGEVCSDISELCLKRLTAAAEEADTQEGDGAEQSDKPAEVKSPAAEVVEENSAPEWVAQELDNLKKSSSTLLAMLEAEAKNLPSLETADIEQQKQLFQSWIQARADAIASKQAAADRVRRIEAIRAKKKELVEKEELYYAFENWNKIEMILTDIDQEGVKEEQEAEYVPPSVARKHNSVRPKNSAKATNNS